jgi:hypothetical protein
MLVFAALTALGAPLGFYSHLAKCAFSFAEHSPAPVSIQLDMRHTPEYSWRPELLLVLQPSRPHTQTAVALKPVI